MEIIIPSVVSVFICLFQPVVNSSWGRNVVCKLKLTDKPEYDVEYWVVKDKFHKSKIRHFSNIETAQAYSKKLLVSHVIFDRHKNIISVNGWGFGKKICKNSGIAWLNEYYEKEKGKINFDIVKQNLELVYELFKLYYQQIFQYGCIDIHYHILFLFKKIFNETEMLYSFGYYKSVQKNLKNLEIDTDIYIKMLQMQNFNILSFWSVLLKTYDPENVLRLSQNVQALRI